MGEDFRLKWNDHHSIFFSTAERLCNGDHLTDVTLSCGQKEFSAHKLVLSICSNYFNQLFSKRPSAKRRPADEAAVVYLKDVDPRHMELLLNFMYRGEINVEEQELMDLLATARGLQIKGLTDDSAGDEPDKIADEPVAGSSKPTPTSGKKRPASNNSAVKNPEPKKIKEEASNDEEDGAIVTYEDEAVIGDEYIDENAEEFNIDDAGGSAVYGDDPAGAQGNPAKKLVKKEAKNGFKCDVCYKKFTAKTSLQRHFALHTGIKHLSCKMCDAKFSRADHLKNHCLKKHLKKGGTLLLKEEFIKSEPNS